MPHIMTLARHWRELHPVRNTEVSFVHNRAKEHKTLRPLAKLGETDLPDIPVKSAASGTTDGGVPNLIVRGRKSRDSIEKKR